MVLMSCVCNYMCFLRGVINDNNNNDNNKTTFAATSIGLSLFRHKLP